MTDALTSIAYNYGSIPDRLMSSIQSGNVEAIAKAVEGLAGDNDGVNRSRRLREAEVIRGEALPPNGRPVSPFPRPQGRPETIRADVSLSSPQAQAQGTSTPQTQSTPSTPPEDGSTEVSRESQPSARRVVQATNEWDQLEAQTQKLLLRLFGNEEAVIQALATGELSEEDL